MQIYYPNKLPLVIPFTTDLLSLFALSYDCVSTPSPSQVSVYNVYADAVESGQGTSLSIYNEIAKSDIFPSVSKSIISVLQLNEPQQITNCACCCLPPLSMVSVAC